MEFSAYPRLTLTVMNLSPPPGSPQLSVEPAAESLIVCEIKPFITPVAFIPMALIPAFLPGSLMAIILLGALIVGAYIYFFAWELRKLAGLPDIRAALAPIGVRSCPGCSYDLFAHPAGAPCPECGRQTPPPPLAV